MRRRPDLGQARFDRGAVRGPRLLREAAGAHADPRESRAGLLEEEGQHLQNQEDLPPRGLRPALQRQRVRVGPRHCRDSSESCCALFSEIH